MAVRDIQAFMRQKALLFDPNLDVSPGSPFDVRVIQPLVRRLGTDPFTVDVTTFINERMAQAFPDLALSEGDALTDLLAKPASLLFDPLVRETRRVARTQSFQDPASLTEEEADALGANFYSPRRVGNLSRGRGRILFAQPQSVAVSPVNFFTSRDGLRFFPQQVQAISTEAMLLNVDAEGLYYFDVNLVAERAGSSYNIGPNQLVAVANVPAATRVVNLTRFQYGEDEETPEEYIGRIGQELGEKSLVTLRGIAGKLTTDFPEVRRLNVVGFNDPEMQRDVLRGGGLGAIVAAGVSGVAVADTSSAALTRRFYTDEVDFESVVLGEETAYVLTVFGAFGSVVAARDLDVLEVVGTHEVDVASQAMTIGSTDLRWTLRKKELTLSTIPGGILFPDGSNGEVAIENDVVHVGGAYDVHVRGSSFDELVLAVDDITDDRSSLAGTDLVPEGSNDAWVSIPGLVYGSDFEAGDATYEKLLDAAKYAHSLRILTGSNAGTYRVQEVLLSLALPVVIVLDRDLVAPAASGEASWQIVDDIDIDLLEPKLTRIQDSDLRTVQGTNVVSTASGTDFSALGVAQGDVLRILSGPDAGDYRVTASPQAPSFDKLELGSDLTRSLSDLDYVVFRPNAGGGLGLPLVRVKSVGILDASGQPIGSSVPRADPIGVVTRSFQNPARGVKHDLTDVRLGLVTQASSAFAVSPGTTLELVVGSSIVSIALTVLNPDAAQLAADISNQVFLVSGFPEIATVVGGNRVGFRPIRGGVLVVGGTARLALFGTNDLQTSGDIRSADVEALGGWDALNPFVDFDTGLDTAQVVGGPNEGFHGGPFTVSQSYSGLSDSLALLVNDSRTAIGFRNFSPQVGQRVQLGSRSLGSARMYFLDPTSIELDSNAVFELDTGASILKFFPDPTLSYQKVPALPGGDQPFDAETTTGSNVLSSPSQDFVLDGIQVGDRVTLNNTPLTGTVALPDPVPNVVGAQQKTLVLSVDGGPDRALAFVRDDTSIPATHITRSGLVSQINSALGEEVCSLTAGNQLTFMTDRDLVIRAAGTINASILGTVAGTAGSSFVLQDQSNASPHAGSYIVTAVQPQALTVTPPFPSSTPYLAATVSSQSYRVDRMGLQRCTTGVMAGNEAEADLFYFDVELVSEGTGDVYNVEAGLDMTVSGYRSDGYRVTTDNPDLSFSTEEQPRLVISRTVLDPGVDDSPRNATQMSGQNIHITYERSNLVRDIQSYLASDTERVVCASPLSRHLIPHFVRFDVTYRGGANESVVVPELEELISGLFPFDALESSDIQKVLLDRGAVSVTNPINILAVVHNRDRTVTLARSQDALTTGRLAAFIPDVLNVTRSTG